MKKTPLLLGLTLIATSLAGCSSSNALEYELSEDRSYYTVKAASKSSSGDIVIPSEFNGLPVKAIANEGFSNRQNITSIKIPESVVSIGDTAFFGCLGIKELKISKNVLYIGEKSLNDSGIINLDVDPENPNYSSLANVLYNKDQTKLLYANKALETIHLADTITSLNDSLFEGNKSLISINIPNSVKEIGKAAFRECTNLESVTLPSELVSIGASAFENCVKLTSVNLPDKVEEIGDAAFRNCQSLTSFAINDTLTKVGEEVFASCLALDGNKVIEGDYESTYLGSSSNPYQILLKVKTADSPTEMEYKMKDSCISIAEGAFLGNTFIGKIQISKLLKEIDFNTFNDLYGLFSISVSDESEVFSSENDLLFNKDKTEVVYAPLAIEEAILPDTVKTIGEEFMDHSELSDVVIPSGLEYIETGAFTGTKIKVGASSSKEYVAKYLGNEDNPNLVLVGFRETSEESYTGGDRTFTYTVSSGCKLIAGNVIKGSLLKKVNIPSSVKFIGDNNFVASPNLTFNEFKEGGLKSFYFGNNSNPKVVLYKVDVDPGYVGEEGSTFTISKSTNVIMQNAFLSVPSVTIKVEEGNTELVYDDGVIYNHDKSKIIYVNSNKTGTFNVPEGYESLSLSIMDKCTNLQSIVLPESFVDYEDDLFAKCAALENIVVNEYNEKFASKDGVLYNKDLTEIIYVPSAIKSFEVPESVENIQLGALKNCKAIESLTLHYLGGSLQNHNNHFISYLFGSPKVSNMEKAIPASLKKVTLLEGEYNVVDTNAFYAHEYIETIVLPDNIIAFGDHAFFGCVDLKEINVPENVSSIGNWAFFNCKSLTEINLPKALKYVGRFCFRDCEKLETINFEGTVAEWNAIQFGRDWNSNLKASQVKCADGIVSI